MPEPTTSPSSWDSSVGQGAGGRVVKIPYTSVRGGKRFFEPRSRMVAAGFRPTSLGPDDEAARRDARRLYEDWTATRDGRVPAPSPTASDRASKETISLGRRYPRGSIGATWQE